MSALKRFLLSFIIFLAIFALLANNITDYFEKILLAPDEPDVHTGTVPGPSPDSEQKTQNTETGGNSFGALVIGKDLATSETDALILVRVNKEKKNIMVCSIPTDTEYEISGHDENGTEYTGSLSFKETIDTYGTDYLIKKITALTGIGIDYHATLGTSEAKTLINTFTGSGVVYTVPEKMEYDDLIEDIDLPEGTQYLTGTKAIQFLRYRTYKSGNGDVKRCTNQTNFIKRFVESALSSENPLKASLLNDSTKKKLLSGIKTNVTTEDIARNLDLVFNLSEYDFDSVTFPYFRAMITAENVSSLHQTFKQYR